ncbi:Ig-like domain-containing protein [Marinoscillum furvescens]|nr:Ig-like domain-containing protein [Marinoscillum furvescens]
MKKVILSCLSILLCFGLVRAQGPYEESLTIPVYDPNNSEMGMITSPANFSSVISDTNKRIFFIQPGDYTSLGTTALTGDGTSSNPRWLIYYDPNNPTDYTTHPVDMDPSDYVTFGRLNVEGAYWRLDRIRAIGDEPTRNPNIYLVDDHIVLNRCLLEHGGGGAGQISMGGTGSGKGPADYCVVQHCVIRNTQISTGDDNHGIKFDVGEYNRIVHNEIYNFAGDGIQLGPNQPFKGTVIYDNDIYIDPAKYSSSVSEIPHENGIDIKNAGGTGSGEHVLIKNNRFRNLGKTPGGTSPNTDQGAIDHSNDGTDKSYILIEDNIFYECRVPINTKGGKLTDHYTIRRNLMYKAERFAIWMPKNTEHNHDIYLNTVVEVEALNGDQEWMESRATSTRIVGNVIIDGGGTLSDSPSGTVSDYNAFYNSSGHSFEGTNSISYSTAADADQTDYSFTMGMFTGTVSLTIPNAVPTTSSPHYNLTNGITFGNNSGIGYDNSDTYTQSWAGALSPNGNGANPVVSITSHSNNQTVDGTITLTASASDPDNDLAGVQFKLDGSDLGAEDTGSPYSISWNTTTASEGEHTLQAVGRDDNGNLGYSATITVIVDNQTDVAPTVSITSPSNSSTVEDKITVTASASDSNGDLVGVQFKLDGENLGDEDTSYPYSACWDTKSVSNGTYSLTAVARDATGMTTTSSAISVTVDNPLPTCVVLPNTNTWTNTDLGSQSGTVVVEFDVIPYQSNVNSEIGVSDGNASSANDVAAMIRFQSGKIHARDNQGYPSTHITYIEDETYHIKMVIDVSNHTYDVYANADGDTPTQIGTDNAFHSNSSSITSFDKLAAILKSTSTGYQVDVCNIQVDGNGSSSSAPTVSITSPSNNSTVSGTISIDASASDVDGDLSGVQFKLNGSNLGSQDTSSPYSYSWNTTGVSNGVYTLTAEASDAAGNTTTSSSITVTVSNASGGSAPTVSVTAPSHNATVSNTVTISASASDPDSDLVGVQFKLNGSNLGSQDTSAPFSLSWDSNGVSNGSHTITALATDAAGNSTTSSSITVNVSNSGGSCETLPNNNSYVNTSIATQTSNFTIEFDVTPSHNLHTEIGLSDGSVSHENDVAAVVRFKSGKIHARDNQGWPSTNIPFSAGDTYHIKMVVDLTNHTYDVFANKTGDSPSQIANDNDFHSNSSSITQIDKLPAILKSTNSGYEVDVCNISVNSSSRQGSLDLVKDKNVQTTVNVFPNPVTNLLKISQGGDDLSGQFSIRSISGAIMSEGVLFGKQHQIITEHLPAGVYLLDIRLQDDTSQIFRIIKD